MPWTACNNGQWSGIVSQTNYVTVFFTMSECRNKARINKFHVKYYITCQCSNYMLHINVLLYEYINFNVLMNGLCHVI